MTFVLSCSHEDSKRHEGWSMAVGQKDIDGYPSVVYSTVCTDCYIDAIKHWDEDNLLHTEYEIQDWLEGNRKHYD